MSDELAEAARLAGQRLLAWEEDREWLTDHEVALYREAIANHYLSTLTAPTPVDWQPIETAPKDRHIILTEEGDVYSGFWHDGSQCYGHRGKEGWFYTEDEGSLLTASNAHPVAWREWPDPPKDLTRLSRPKPQ